MPDVRYGQNIDLSGYEVRNFKVHVVNGLPAATPQNAGRLVYNSADGRCYWSNGSAWVLRATDSDQLGGQGGAYYLARGNQTGTQTASTISDFTTAVQAIQWRTMAAPTAAVALNGQKITGLADGTATTDAATFGQLQAVAQQSDFKASARLAASTNVTPLSGLTAVDAVVPTAGDRVLLTGQTDATQNGLWLVAAGAWTRPPDADTAGDVSGGSIVPVEDGATNADTLWMNTNSGAVNPGVTAQTWIKYGASQGEIVIAGAGLTKTGSTLDVGAGNGIIVTADAIAIDPAVVLRKVSGLVGNSSASITINHGLGTKNIHVSVYETATGDEILCGITRTDNNNVTLNFAATPAASNTYTYVIFG